MGRWVGLETEGNGKTEETSPNVAFYWRSAT